MWRLHYTEHQLLVQDDLKYIARNSRGQSIFFFDYYEVIDDLFTAKFRSFAIGVALSTSATIDGELDLPQNPVYIRYSS